MKLSVEAKPFGRMLEMLGDLDCRSVRGSPLRLNAFGKTLIVEQGELAAEIEAMIWQEGRCGVSAKRLKEAVQQNVPGGTLLIELEDDQLRVGDFYVSCVTSRLEIHSHPPSRIFFASDLGVVPSAGLAALEAVA